MRISAPASSAADSLLAAGDNASAASDDSADTGLFARLLQDQPATGSPENAGAAATTGLPAKTVAATAETSGKTAGRTVDPMPTPVRTASVEKPAANVADAIDPVISKAISAANDPAVTAITDNVKTVANFVVAVAADVVSTDVVTSDVVTSDVAATDVVARTTAASGSTPTSDKAASTDRDTTLDATLSAAVTAAASTAEPDEARLTSTVTVDGTAPTLAAKTSEDQLAASEPAVTAQSTRLPLRLQTATTARQSKTDKPATTTTTPRRAVDGSTVAPTNKKLSDLHRDDEQADDTNTAVANASVEQPADSGAPATDLQPAQATATAPAPAPAETAVTTNTNSGVAVNAAPNDPVIALADTNRDQSQFAAVKVSAKPTGKAGGNSGKELPSTGQTDATTTDQIESLQLATANAQPDQATTSAAFQSLLANTQTAGQANNQSVVAADSSSTAQPQALVTANGSSNPITVSTGASATTATNSPLFTASYAMGSNGFSEETVHHVRWLKDHDLHSAELQLHPAELGRLSISIDIRDGQASVQLLTNTNEARELLERALPELRQMLAQNGMTLTDSQVSQQSQQQFQQHRDGRGLRQLPELFNMPELAVPDITARPALFRASGGSHRIDHYV